MADRRGYVDFDALEMPGGASCKKRERRFRMVGEGMGTASEAARDSDMWTRRESRSDKGIYTSRLMALIQSRKCGETDRCG